MIPNPYIEVERDALKARVAELESERDAHQKTSAAAILQNVKLMNLLEAAMEVIPRTYAVSKEIKAALAYERDRWHGADDIPADTAARADEVERAADYQEFGPDGYRPKTLDAKWLDPRCAELKAALVEGNCKVTDETIDRWRAELASTVAALARMKKP